MRRERSAAPFAVAVLLAFAAPASAEPTNPVDRSGDVIAARSVLEARGRTHGEVRLVRRGDTVVIQTLLVTRTLKRVAGRIRDKEEANWPAGSREVGTARIYLEALEAAVAKVLDVEQTDRTRRLLIEIELSHNAGGFLFSQPVTGGDEQGVTLLVSEPISRLEVPCSWARREIQLIAEDRKLDLGSTPLPACAASRR